MSSERTVHSPAIIHKQITGQGTGHCPAGIFINIISNVTKNGEAGHGPVHCPSQKSYEMKNLDMKTKLKLFLILPFLPITILLSRRENGHPLEGMENLSFKTRLKRVLSLPLMSLAILIIWIREGNPIKDEIYPEQILCLQKQRPTGQGTGHCRAGIFKNIISNVTKNEDAGHGPVPCPLH